MFDVYLVPVGSARYELYCEVPDDPQDSGDQASAGIWRRMRQRFREMLAEAERDRRQPQPAPENAGWLGRIKSRVMRLVAESIAEQRLLWHLRSASEARLHYPDDLGEAQARAILRGQLRRDFDKHRFWLIIDSLLFIVSGLFMLIPGPNVLAYYFAFRMVGHYFSMRGARQGLAAITWYPNASPPLAELRSAIGLKPEIRVRHVLEVAERLRLEHLASFFERSAMAPQ